MSEPVLSPQDHADLCGCLAASRVGADLVRCQACRLTVRELGGHPRRYQFRVVADLERHSSWCASADLIPDVLVPGMFECSACGLAVEDASAQDWDALPWSEPVGSLGADPFEFAPDWEPVEPYDEDAERCGWTNDAEDPQVWDWVPHDCEQAPTFQLHRPCPLCI